MIKYIFTAFLASFFLLTSLFLNTNVMAADFNAEYSVVYDISNDGLTHVTQNVSFINQTKNKYATRYNISVGSSKLTNFRAKDGGGEIKPEVNTKEDNTDITLNFNDKVVGFGRSINFTLSYDSTDAAVRNGQLWEVNIPKLATEENISQYSLILKVPSSFGPIHYINPTPAKTEDGDKRIFTFNKDEVFKSGINAAFGEVQVFDLNLKYHLYNQNLFNTIQEIALPPDTENQNVNYFSIDPKPSEVYADKDGNYLAKYQLNAGQKLDIVANLQVKTVSNDQNFHTKKWSSAELESFLGPDKYWESNHPLIVAKAKELKTPENIYKFVSSTLKYSYDRLKNSKIERYGAVSALSNPNDAICMEYTDLTIALLRAAGIPARELNGYGYTENRKLRPISIGGEEQSDVLHAWPEYYDTDKSRWVQIDPTWSSTTGGLDYFHRIDNNHLVFVIKGFSSEYPHPAGSYKYNGQKDKDVDVVFAKENKFGPPQINVEMTNQKVVSGFPGYSGVKIANLSGVSMSDNSLTVTTQKLGVLPSNNLRVDIIPPFGNLSVDLKFKETDILAQRKEEIKIVLRGYNGTQEYSPEFLRTLEVQPFYVYAKLPILLITVPLGLLVLITIILRTQVSKFKPTKTPSNPIPN